ncbi:uncharacterized protein J8A68_004485 [[Candida] subhashii]|uniref:Uncharacterized protein n=1 Tax=[Candida] subhashii TaxID=561895 RepID=A0A8J5UV03_9ASCO|nr:uncharacterized protein J8A68_004485 [[Candida] subhashii]KAG7661985.1 hypothetical protein J8A68_004485 [[Candida] subhashii]
MMILANSNVEIIPMRLQSHFDNDDDNNFNIINVRSISNISLSDFDNIDNIFIIEDTNTTILNTIKLNRPELDGEFRIGNPYPSQWIEVQFLDTPKPSQRFRVPLTSCLNQLYGAGGSLEFAQSATYYITTGVDYGSALDLIWYYHRLSNTVEFTTEVTWRISYSCNVPPGKIGQIFISPYLTEFSNVQTRKVSIVNKSRKRSKKGKKKHKHRKKRVLHFGEWELENSVRLFDISRSPIVECITKEEYLDCHGDKNPYNYFRSF